jgi:hypothetical protein
MSPAASIAPQTGAAADAALLDSEPLDNAAVAAFAAGLARMDRDISDDERVDRLRLMEETKAALAAAQAYTTVDLDASQRAAQAAAGVPARDLGKGIASQVGLARRSPRCAARSTSGWPRCWSSRCRTRWLP